MSGNGYRYIRIFGTQCTVVFCLLLRIRHIGGALEAQPNTTRTSGSAGAPCTHPHQHQGGAQTYNPSSGRHPHESVVHLGGMRERYVLHAHQRLGLHVALAVLVHHHQRLESGGREGTDGGTGRRELSIYSSQQIEGVFRLWGRIPISNRQARGSIR